MSEWNKEKRLRHTEGEWKVTAHTPYKSVVCSPMRAIIAEVPVIKPDLESAANLSLILMAPKLAKQHQKELNILSAIVKEYPFAGFTKKLQEVIDEKSELLDHLI